MVREAMYFAFKQNTQFNDGRIPWVVAFVVYDYKPEMEVRIRASMNRAALKDTPDVAIDLMKRRLTNENIEWDTFRVLGDGGQTVGL